MGNRFAIHPHTYTKSHLLICEAIISSLLCVRPSASAEAQHQYLVAQEEAGKLIRTRLEFILLTGAHKGALPGWIQIGSPTPAAPAEEQVERQLKYRFVRVQLDIVVELKRLL